MRRIFSSPITALAAGFCLRLFFVLKFPANSGDTVLYEQMATNWLKHHVYAMDVGGVITAVDLRMPGYPAFLALVYAVIRRTGADARFWVMLAQILVDLGTCVAIAFLAKRFAPGDGKPGFIAALWLAALCPFIANYTAVPLTEVFAVFFTIQAILGLIELIHRPPELDAILRRSEFLKSRELFKVAGLAGLFCGLGTLFRPETPILLVAALPIIYWLLASQAGWKRALTVVTVSAAACVLPLIPWAFRNAVTLHEFQFLAPKNSNLPGELVPYGFMAWEKTWLYRVSDCYLVPWKLNDESIAIDSIPARAFDTPYEKERVGAILEQYNTELTLTPEEDAAFAQLARERTARHPLRTYARLPLARAVTIWFTPRIELLPVSGNIFPLIQTHQDDPLDQFTTLTLFFLNIFYIGLALWGAVRLWRWNSAARPAIVVLAAFILLRTAFLTTLETPEPRYVLVCFPAIIALAAQVFAGNPKQVD
jgi:4-amino-4-deoxy-L-arabinose transferase-like glycosyltransferase